MIIIAFPMFIGIIISIILGGADVGHCSKNIKIGNYLNQSLEDKHERKM